MAYYSLELYHHGVKGQEWGQRNAPWYPIEAYRAHLANEGYSEKSINKIMGKVNSGESDKTISREVKRQTRIKNHQIRRSAKKQKKIEDEERAKELEKEQAISRKDDAVRNGDIDYLNEHSKDFTDQEQQQLVNRYKYNQNVTDLINNRNTAEGKRKSENIIRNLGTVADATSKMANIVSNSTNLYNGIAKVTNTFAGTNLKIIGENQDKGKTTLIETFGPTGTLEKRTKTVNKNGNIYTRNDSFVDKNNNNISDDYEEEEFSKFDHDEDTSSKKKDKNNKQQSKQKDNSNTKKVKDTSNTNENYIEESLKNIRSSTNVRDSLNYHNQGAAQLASAFKRGIIDESEYKKGITTLNTAFDNQMDEYKKK